MASDNAVWVSSYEYSPFISRYNGREWETVRDYDDEPYMPFLSVAADIDSSVWFGGPNGVGRCILPESAVKSLPAARSTISMTTTSKTAGISAD